MQRVDRKREAWPRLHAFIKDSLVECFGVPRLRLDFLIQNIKLISLAVRAQVTVIPGNPL